MASEKPVYRTLNLPQEVVRQIRLVSFQRGMTMPEYVLSIIGKTLERDYLQTCKKIGKSTATKE